MSRRAFSPGEGPRGGLARAWPLLLVAFLYLATSPFHEGLNNPNEMVRVYMARALAERGEFDIDAEVRDWGMVDDKAVRDGHLYSSKAPLQSLLGAAVYPAARPLLEAAGAPVDKRRVTWALRVLGSAVPGIALAGLLLAWARRRARELGAPAAAGAAVALTLALGTMLYPYALTFTGHLLSALAVGGVLLAVVGLARTRPGSRAWATLAVLAGLAGGATPFAEYPAALAAGPLLLAALAITPGWLRRAELAALGLLGGAAPVALGLRAHDRMWGHPLRTGYSFLENRSYVELHGHGFFGVSLPTAEAFAGALFSPGTGLFFFSPVLLIGLAALLHDALRARGDAAEGAPPRLPRAIAVAALVAVALEVLFISSHRGWRGGWTVGPRYIIPVVPILGLWLVEALATPALVAHVMSLGALSVLMTGAAASLYPHLSDVFTNPLATFLWPSYLRGETTYGLGTLLGLEGHAANAVHGLPLLLAVSAVALAGLRAHPGPHPTARRAGLLAVTFGAAVALLAAVPEADARAARRENQRLWGFWEPARERPPPPGRVLGRAFDRSRATVVTSVGPDGDVRPCLPADAPRCRHGDQPWQRFGPELVEVGGRKEPLLFLHPVAGREVRALLPVPPGARTARLRHGLADASVASDNPSPVHVDVAQGGRALASLAAGEDFGLAEVDLALTSTLALELTLTVAADGARVYGFDVLFTDR